MAAHPDAALICVVSFATGRVLHIPGRQWPPFEETPVSVKARFYCGTKCTIPGGQTYVRMHAVYSTDPAHPNKAFTEATPAGEFMLCIAPGMPAAEAFTPGVEYELDIRRV